MGRNSVVPDVGQMIAYYKKLCQDFPQVTFKLSDIEGAKKSTLPYHIGYKGNSYQQGENFSSPNQCSIDIDVSVIRKMMADPEYERQLRGTIQNKIMDFPTYVQWAQKEGYGYCYVGLSDEGGKLVEYMGFSHDRVSTDEEMREIWKDNALVGDDWVKESCDKLLNNTKNQMQEAFFAMFDQAQQRRSKMF